MNDRHENVGDDQAIGSLIDPSRCPLCGVANSCVMADGAEPGTPCWCTSLSIPRETLAKIPEEALNKACICRNCAAGR